MESDIKAGHRARYLEKLESAGEKAAERCRKRSGEFRMDLRHIFGEHRHLCAYVAATSEKWGAIGDPQDNLKVEVAHESPQ